MLNFVEMNRMVVEAFEKHAKGRSQLFGDAARAYRAEKNALLVEHGWDTEAFDAKVEEYASDADHDG